MKKRLLAVILVAAMGLTMLSACSSSKEDKDTKDTTETAGETKEQKTVDVTLNEVAHSIFYAPMYIAIEEGYFEEEGINLDLVTGFGVL